MPANIATINGQDAIAYIDSTPWHGMGPNIISQMRAAQPAERIDLAMRAAGLDYSVGSMGLQLADGTAVSGHKASVRFAPDGSVAAVLGVVGEGYQHIQNGELFSLLRPLVEDFGAVPAVAGALGNGERAWMLLRMADSQITPIEGDDVNGYFLLHAGHGGDNGVNGLITPIRVVCQNTLSLATGRGSKAMISIRHTGDAGAKLDQAAKIVRQLGQTMKETGATFAAMARRQLTANEVIEYIARAVPNTDPKAATVSPIITARRDTIAKLVFYGRGAAMANQAADTTNGGASLWAAYNAVTEYVDHVRTAEAQSPAGLKRAQESAIFGGNAEIKAGAFTLARELVAA